MRSKLLILAILLLSIALAGQALAAATVTVVPSNVPKGAYVNGGGVADNDNAYFQQVKIDLNDYHADAGVFTLYLPTGAYLADPDGDTILSEDISVVYTDAAGETTKIRYFGTNAQQNQLYFVYFTGDGTDLHPPAYPNNNESFYISFPITTDLNPAVASDDYYVTFGNPAGQNFKVADLSIANGEIVSEAIAVGDYVKGQATGLGVVAALNDGADDVIRVVYNNAGNFGNPENIDTVLLYPESGYDVADGFVAATDAASTGYETDRMALMEVADLTGFAVGTYVSATASTFNTVILGTNDIIRLAFGAVAPAGTGGVVTDFTVPPAVYTGAQLAAAMEAVIQVSAPMATVDWNNGTGVITIAKSAVATDNVVIDATNNEIVLAFAAIDPDAGGALVAGDPFTYTIPANTYTGATLAAALELSIQAGEPNAATVTYNAGTGEITITGNADGNVSLTYAGSTLAPVIGFGVDVGAAASIVGAGAGDVAYTHLNSTLGPNIGFTGDVVAAPAIATDGVTQWGVAPSSSKAGVVSAIYNSAGNDSLYVVYSGPDFAAADALDALVAPGAFAASDEVIVSVSDVASTLDNVANGSGATITYATDRQQLYSTAVTFSDYMKANNDTTSTHGQKHPASTSVFATALPDLVYDGATGLLPTDNTGYFGFATNNLGVTLDGVNNNATADAEVKYYVWAAQDSTLEYVWSSLTGVIPVLVYDPIAYKGYIPEADAATTGLATSNVPEGTWFFYVTSSVTGRNILARSGSVVVRHWPYVKTVGWDYDGDGVYTEAADNNSVTLDSGRYFGYNGVAGGPDPRKNLDIFASVDDYDDNASIRFFYSNSGSLTSAEITTTGEAPNLVVTGLTGATALADTTLFDDVDEDTNGYAKVPWDIAPTGQPFIPANPYYIYVVANDGTNQDITVAKGSDGTTDLVTVKHSPNMTIDALTEYNKGTDLLNGADVTIDASQTDVVMLSWGKTGVGGDVDIDDSATIEFYIDYDDAQNGTADYTHNAGATLRTDASNSGNAARGPHRIVANLQEDPEAKNLSYYAWDLAADFAQTGWRPEDQESSTGTVNYHIYAVMDEGSSGTTRVFVLGGFTNPHEINFARVPFTRLIDPPYNGITVNSDETFRLRYDAVDLGTQAQVGVFLVKDDQAIDGVLHPTTAKMHQMWSATAGKTYALTDNNGWVNPDVASTDGSWLAESPYPAKGEYPVTLRLPSQKDKTVILNVGPKAGAADLANFATGSYVTALNGATGLVINKNEAAGAGADDYITVSYTGQDFITGAAQVSPGAVYNVTQAVIINSINGPAYGRYIYSMNSGANGVTSPATYNSLSDGTWWPYIAVDDSSYYKVRVTTAAMANVDPGDYLLNQANNKVGRVIAEPAAGTEFDVVYPGPAVFGAAPNNVIEISDPSDITSTVGDPAAAIAAIGAAVVSNNFTGWNITLYRAPGPVNIVNADESASQKNLMLTPVKPIVAQGDTITFSVRAADENHDVDLVDVYIAVEKDHFELVNSGAPFTDTTPGTLGSLIANELIDDAVNNRWILHATIYNSSNPINPADWDLGSELCNFKVVSKGTENAIGASSAVYYVNEPARGWTTVFSNDGNPLYISMSSSTVNIQPRGIIEGIVQFEGRTTSDMTVNFDLRKRGSYVACSDTAFYNRNDGAIADSTYKLSDVSAAGVQFKLDKDGKFRLFKVPTGEWDLVVRYNRYLAKLQPVSIYPGLDTLFVSFGKLLGGDAVGYVDSTGAAWPNNVINSSDITRISDAYLDTADSTRWDDGVYNYKWADINEDGIVKVEDLTMATANYTGSDNKGAQPVYQKPVVQHVASNMNALVEFMGVPSKVQAGQRFTIQVVARNAEDVKGYFLNLSYDPSALTFEGIVKGGFLEDQTYSFPSVGTGTVAFTNTVYGTAAFAGDGILAEISFTANRDGEFLADMVDITEATFVNSNFTGESVIKDNSTGTDTNAAPALFSLKQNFPNPFNPSTMIGFSVPTSGLVTVKVYDILGRSVKTLVNANMTSGNYSVVWDATDDNGKRVSTGVYLYKITAGSFSATKRMLLMK